MFHFEKKRYVPGRILVSMSLLLLSLGVVVACGSQAASVATSTPTSAVTRQSSIPTITIKAMDYSYNQPATVPAGLVDITFTNNGMQPHHATIIRLNDGVIYDQFRSTLLKQGDAALRLGVPLGGPNALLPGQSQEVILNLPSGNYASVCFVPDANNVPHYMKGMVQSFIVSGSTGSAQPPQEDATMLLKDFSYGLPPTLKAAPTLVKVTNQGTQPHEIVLLQLASGKTMQDVIAFFQKPAGPPPFNFAGGLAALAPGSTAWMKLHLTPGNYAAVCFITDPTTHKPHIMLGMARQITVQ